MKWKQFVAVGLQNWNDKYHLYIMNVAWTLQKQRSPLPLVQQQATLLQPKDVINAPVTLEFLGLNDVPLVTENDLGNVHS